MLEQEVQLVGTVPNVRWDVVLSRLEECIELVGPEDPSGPVNR